MTANILVALAVLLMAYWWSNQGLFSALLNLLITLISAAVAFSLWEPLVYGALLNAVPEWAWGAGLLVAFGVTHLVLRVVVDTVIGGNLNFPPAIDKIGGAAFGFAAGVLTVGILVIGIQMMGVGDFFGHKSYSLDDHGPKPAASLWLPVDTATSGILTTLSAGSMSPILDEASLATAFPEVDGHTGLAIHAALFPQAAFDKSRHAIRADNVSLIKGGYLTTNAPPQKLSDIVPTRAGSQTVVMGVETVVQGDGGKGAGDSDGQLRITRPQVQLIYATKADANAIAFPVGYIQNGQAAAFLATGDYAYSTTGKTVHHWIFQLPVGAKPLFMRLKGARVDIDAKPNTAPEALGALLTYKPSPKPAATDAPTSEGVPGAPSGTASPASADFVKVSDKLPSVVSKNQLSSQGFSFSDEGLISGEGRLAADRGIGRALAINRIHHPANMAVVQVYIGGNQPQSLLGRIKAKATATTQTPVLRDAAGNMYQPIGYFVGNNAGWRVKLDPGAPLRSLEQVPVAAASAEDQVILIYLVGKGVTLTKFDLGIAQSQDINISTDKADDEQL